MPENIFTQWVRYMKTVFRAGDPAQNRELNYRESRSNKTSIKSYPHRCYLEITNQCNLRCPMCGQSWFEGKRSYIPDEVLAKIKEIYPYLQEINVFGFGESLVDKRFFNILADIPPHIRKKYVSNGLLINAEAAEKMVDLQLHELFISLDSATEETFQFIRGQKGFQRIIQNIKELNRIKKEKNSQYPIISLAYTFYRRNIEEFFQFMELAHSLEIPRITGDYLIVYRPELEQESLYYEQEKANVLFPQFRQRAKELGIVLIIPKTFEESAKEEASTQLIECYEPWEFIYFRADGKIGPCCVNDIQLGDLNTMSFDEIWNGAKYQAFRKMVNTTRKDPNCAQCMGRGMRKLTERSFHIKFLDKEGKVIKGENTDHEQAVSSGSGSPAL
jgi:radical SAM protein with 4Fe4S-binding SPASM domain